MSTPIGQKLGSFRIEEKVGSGAMGVVYRAVSETTGRAAAVKVITGETNQKGNAYERFKRESEILQQFRHPNIVRFLAVGRYQGTSYFAMEYVQGPTLDKVIEQRGFLPWQEVVALGIQVCDALHYAHQRGVVHRDLKPSNLMLSDKGQVKLTDFGIAKDLDATALTATGRTLGTAAYMAPEQIRGTPEVSHKTDLYSLGVVLFQMLAGESPFQGSTAVVLMHKHLTEPPPRPGDKVSELPVALDDLVVNLMAKAPADRPWDAAAVGMALTELRDKHDRGETIAMVWPGTAEAPARAPRKPGKGRKKKKKQGFELDEDAIKTGLLVLALLAILALVGYLAWPPSARYYFRHAQTLMASDDPANWSEAEHAYLDELDRRHPNHPYRDEVRAWRDRIALHKVERRAKILEKPNLGGLSQPKTVPEKLFVDVFNLAVQDAKDGRDLEAVRRWREMAATLRPDDPEDRPWALLAKERAEELDREVADRVATVSARLARADDAVLNGRLEEAEQIRRDVIARYGHHAELAALIERARAKLPKEEPKPEPSPPADEGPGSAKRDSSANPEADRPETTPP